MIESGSYYEFGGRRWVLAEDFQRLRAEVAEKDKRIKELERTHHSMEDDSGRQYAVIPVEWIDAARKMGMEEHRLFGTMHILGVLEKLGIVADSRGIER